MHTVEEIRKHFVATLSPRYGKDEAQAMFRAVAMDAGKNTDRLHASISAILPELLTGRPFQYVLEEAWFYGLPFFVNESVLIPRPETEELVHRIITQYKPSGERLKIIDIGTGSGCIALTLKYKLPAAIVYALDVSGQALGVARKNAHSHALDIQFIQADILEWETVIDRGIRFDVVVSNPPYITPEEKNKMAPHVLHYEPEMALFVTEEAPLLFYQHIADFALSHLNPGGRLYFEINREYGGAVVELLEKKGFSAIRLHQDMQGSDRMVEALKD